MDNKKLRLRQSVGIAQHGGEIDFFNANTREILKLKIHFPNIVTVLSHFDGNTSINDILALYPDLPKDGLTNLVGFLFEHYILIEQNTIYSDVLLKQHYRLINFLEDYKHATQAVIHAIATLKKAKVMIIGLGAVGSLIATFLVKNGIENLMLVDNDTVEKSNLHRQYFFEENVGQSKLETLSHELTSINQNIHIKLIEDVLDKNFFNQHPITNIDLIINCADYPSVDVTSEIVASYAMKNKIPHIIGGGYNLHLTLVGQTIIPFETACYKCFDLALKEMNNQDLVNVKKLHRENRKIGSFPPLSGMAATLAAIDAFKLLIGERKFLQQVEKRIEFNIKAHKFNMLHIPRNPHCPWCGDNRVQHE